MPLLLRVKRLRGDVPVESFETERLNKVSRLETNDQSSSATATSTTTTTTFRYIGSQSTEANAVTEPDLDKLDKLDPQGSFKLQWNSTSGKIFGKGVSSVPCAVQIHNLKRSLPAGDTDSIVPVKMMRIIDLTPDRTKDDLTDALQAVTGTESPAVPPEELDYVYDLYRLERQAPSPSIDRSPSPLSRFGRYARDEIVFDEDYSEEDEGHGQGFVDDEDDSNSESNWRNDYPDEEDVASASDLSDSESRVYSDSRSSSGLSSPDSHPVVRYSSHGCHAPDLF